MAELRVGTSGWHYPHWREVFYPSGLSSGEYLSFYSRHFDTVEINNSFYRLPGLGTFRAWAESTPQGFVFTVKASRYITHMKKLRGCDEALSSLLENAGGLGEKLGPILFQLPPRWKVNPSRLEGFIATLPRDKLYAFEFRDPSWFQEDIYRLLEGFNCALCSASSPSFPESRRATAGFAFLRFHGGKVLYGSKYSKGELKEWAAFARGLLDEGRDVYAYFNNDAYGYAVEDARVFRELVSPA
jgi:uncharacterized protein YecE (DUF72 family)